MGKRTGARVGLEEIVATATRLFAAKGFHGTTMRDLSGELGLHAGSLYVHIRDKEDLLERIVGSISTRHEQEVGAVLAQDLPAAEKLREVCRRQLELIVADTCAYRVYFHEWRHLEPARQAQIVAVRDGYEQVLRELLDQAVQEGAVRADVDRDMAVRALLGMVNWAIEWLSPDGPMGPADVADVFVGIFLRGVQR